MARSYKDRKDAELERLNEQARRGRDIGDIPPVANPERRAATERNLRLFLDTYFPFTFDLPWSDDHLLAISLVEMVVLDGGLYALAMPRGNGKTSIVEGAAQWAILHGHRRFVVPIASDEKKADSILDSIKMEFETNDELIADFPESLYPVTQIEGIAHRCKGQLYKGERTHIEWNAKEIVMPTIPGSKASGAIIKVAGITGSIRGMKHKRTDGKTARPDFVIPDDPQTDESSKSASQCQTREDILSKTILGLAGPGKKISAIMPCTVINTGDMADRFLDRGLHPDWNGTKTRMLVSLPTNERLWEKYKEIRDDSFRSGNGGREATEFYAANREAMDLGAKAAWEARFDPDELSAIQHAMNIKLYRPFAFAAEYQNEPLAAQESRADDLSPDQVAAKINRVPRRLVPVSCNRLTAFIDVQGTMLFYCVAAWEDDFTGYVVDYGSFPDQKRAYFTLRDSKITLADVIKGASGLEGHLYGGLERLCDKILGRDWLRDDGASLRIEKCPIDANWGASTAVVKQFCRQSVHSGVLIPSHGKYVGASSTPMAEWPVKPGERAGLNWRIRSMEGSKSVRSLLFDSNYWKSFVFSRFSTAMGDRGCLSLFGDKPGEHRLFADHLTAEYRVRTFGRGREVDEWKLRPERPDNHWLDCLSGCAVAASIAGVALPETATRPLAKSDAKRAAGFEEFKRRQAERKANRARVI